jgi:hypothetical protein
MLVLTRRNRYRLMDEAAGADAGGAGGPVAAAAPPGGPAGAPPAPAVAAPLPGTIDAPEAAAPAVPAAPAADAPIVTYDSTGDVGLDLALDFVGKLGFGPEHAAMVAAESGDFGPLKAALGALGEKAKGFEKFLALAEKASGDRKAAAETKVKADQEAINKVVGGQEEWNKIAAWARENAEPAEKAEINAALKAGGLAAKAVAAYLKGCYAGAPNTVVTPAAAVVPGGGSTPPAGAGPLSAGDYSKEVAKLSASMGYGFEGSKEYQALQARRIATVRAGGR